MIDELKQWEYEKGYTKGYLDGRASVIEELEKIKAEIMSIGNWREIYEVPSRYTVECLNIINDHIAELKGSD